MTIFNYSFDGSGNSLTKPSLNAVNTEEERIGPNTQGPGGAPATGPNPRIISNTVLGGPLANTNDPTLSAVTYAFGQFVDHDLDAEKVTGTAPINIPVPAGDPEFPAGSTIALTRAATGPTGNILNTISGWLDGSQIYGSSATSDAGLRGPNGTLLASPGNNLPVVNGQFVAGDLRVTENPDLTALQNLFQRNHNRLAAQLAQVHPGWTSDQIFNEARAINTAELQNVVYTEFLPAILGPNAIKPYAGYDPNADPTTSQEFTAAAYRFGHSIVSNQVNKLDNNGKLVETNTLAAAFFATPASYGANGGTDGLLRSISSDHAQVEDAHIVDGLRNLLVDPPDGTDLAAINIARGRDVGLPTFNQERVALGLAPYQNFTDFTDAKTAAALQSVYGSVDAVDLWVGGLAESHAPGALVGPTFQAIIARHFEGLRDGDHLWWQNQAFDPATQNTIAHTTLSDMIQLNTDTVGLQPDVFIASTRITSARLDSISKSSTPANQAIVNGDKTIIAGPKAAMVNAGPGDDTIVASAKIGQVLNAGSGTDVFQFVGPGHTTVINGFKEGTDKIDFGVTVGDISQVNIKPMDNNTVITADNNTVTVSGVPNLNPTDFILHPTAVA